MEAKKEIAGFKMEPNAEEVCSERDRHALEAAAYAAASQASGDRSVSLPGCNGWHFDEAG